MSSTSPPTTSKSPPKYAKAFGYLLDPNVIYEQAIEDGTNIEGQFSATVATYQDQVMAIRNPDPDMPPVYCVVAGTNM